MNIDFHAPGFIADPYPTYARLLREAPTHFRAASGDWLIARYADVATLSRHPLLGHSQLASSPASPATGDPLLDAAELGRRCSGRWLAKCNPPEHTRLRALTQADFHPRAVTRLTGFIETAVSECLDRPDPYDVMAELARPLPARVICHMLSLPEEQRAQLMALVRQVTKATDLEPAPADELRGWFALSALSQRLAPFYARQPAVGKPDALAALRTAVGRGGWNDDTLLAQATLMLFAGHATVEALIGNAVLAFLRHPEQWARLQAQPELIKAAVEECLRYDPPAQYLSRTVLEDVKLNGQTLLRGQTVLLLIGAAHRDPERFTEPERFDIGRSPNHHLAFGAGIHACPGSSLARLQARIALAGLLRRFPRLEQAGPERWAGGYAVRALTALPVRGG